MKPVEVDYFGTKQTMLYIECECTCPAHRIVFSKGKLDKDEGYEYYLEYRLDQHHNVFKRIILAIKYILNLGNFKSHWDTTMLGVKQRQAIIKFLK